MNQSSNSVEHSNKASRQSIQSLNESDNSSISDVNNNNEYIYAQDQIFYRPVHQQKMMQNTNDFRCSIDQDIADDFQNVDTDLAIILEEQSSEMIQVMKIQFKPQISFKLSSEQYLIDSRLLVSMTQFNNNMKNTQNKMSKFYVILSERDKIKKIQRFFRFILYKKKNKKIKARKIYRKHVILELVESEELYIKDLRVLITQVHEPIIQQCIMTKEEAVQIFHNIDNIYDLNNRFLEELKSSIFKNIKILDLIAEYELKQCYGKIFRKYAQFFKIYLIYCSKISLEKIVLIRKQNQKLNDFITKIESSENSIFRGLNLEAFLIKPVQRLPKYVLLLSDLLKHTEVWHPDYENIKLSLQDFKSVNQKINKEMNKLISSQQLFELQKTIGDKIGKDFIDSTRQMIAVESLNILQQDVGKSVIVYFLTDQIVFTERDQSSLKFLKILYLDEKSFCRTKENLKEFSHLFSVLGKGDSVTFICDTSEAKKRLMSLIDELVNELKERQQIKIQQSTKIKKQLAIQVFALETEERKQVFSSFTLYKLKVICASNVSFTISVRYKELTELEQIVRKDYPGINIPHLSRTNWLSNHKQKIIEARKILAENFLSVLLSSQEIYENPDKILTYLQLPLDFYDKCEVEDERQLEIEQQIDQMDALVTQQMSQLDQNQSAELSFNYDRISSVRKNQSFQFEKLPPISPKGYSKDQKPFTFVSSNQEGDNNQQQQHQHALNEILTFTKANNQRSKPHAQTIKEENKTLNDKIEIFLLDGQSILLDITSQTLVSDTIETIAKKIGLKFFNDFKLFLIDINKNQKLLKDDELMCKIYQTFSKQDLKDNQKKYSSASLFNKIATFMSEKEKEKSRIYMKKYIYLSRKQEELDFQNDIVRLKLITYQQFDDIRNENYQVNLTKYCVYCAFYLYIRHHEYQAQVKRFFSILNFQIFSAAQLPIERIKNFLPQKIFKGFKEKMIMEEIYQQLKEIRAQVQDIQKQYAESDSNNLSQLLKTQIKDRVYLGQLIFLGELYLNPLLGISTFYVEVHQKTKVDVSQENLLLIINSEKMKLSLPKNIYLGISLNFFYFMSPSDKTFLYSTPLANIFDLQCLPLCMKFRLKEVGKDLRFRFDTNQSTDMEHLIAEYNNVKQGIIALNSNQNN